MEKTSCDIGKIIKDAASYYKDRFPKHHFDILLSEEPAYVDVNKEKIRQVLNNILINAVKFSPEGGLVRITGKPEILDFKEKSKIEYQISIEDQGIGMSREQVEKIFDKFFRVDSSNTALEGTGLGMSIVKHIVEAHGGKIRIESELGRGSTVRFTIPTS